MERKSDPISLVVVDSRCDTFTVAAVNEANYVFYVHSWEKRSYHSLAVVNLAI